MHTSFQASSELSAKPSTSTHNPSVEMTARFPRPNWKRLLSSWPQSLISTSVPSQVLRRADSKWRVILTLLNQPGTMLLLPSRNATIFFSSSSESKLNGMNESRPCKMRREELRRLELEKSERLKRRPPEEHCWTTGDDSIFSAKRSSQIVTDGVILMPSLLLQLANRNLFGTLM